MKRKEAHNPLVSVIVPNYNHAKYLDQRLQSVLNQTYQNFELIILDDCSPDDGASKAVIERYRGNPHVSHIVYNEVNSGSTFKQWDKGFELAKGEWIWIAESDDYCDENLLNELMSAAFQFNDCGIAQSASTYVDADGNNINKDASYTGETEYFVGLDYIKRFFIFSNFHMPNASAVIFKKTLIESIPKDYMSMKASGDRLFWIYLLEKTGICQVMKPLNFFRQHNAKVSPRKEADGTQCRENYCINQYMHSKGYITGVNAMLEYKLHYHYISHFPFDSEKIRCSLMRLWFPAWKRLRLTYYVHAALFKVLNTLR